MNIDDPKFTAYALDALSPEEKEFCEPGVLADEVLLREAELTAAFAEKLKTAFTAETNARLSAAHWREIFAEAGVEQPDAVVPFEPEKGRRFPVWALSAAAGVMFGAVVASLAITWNDAPVLLADASPPPAEKASINPEPVIAPQQSPVQTPVSVPQAVMPKNGAMAVGVPRPQVPPVVATSAPQPRKVDEFDDVRIIDESAEIAAIRADKSVEALDAPMPAPELVESEPPDFEDARAVAVQTPKVFPRTSPYFPTQRSGVPVAPPVVVPKPAAVVAAIAPSAPIVSPTRPSVGTVSDAAVDKKVPTFALNSPPAKRITVTIPNGNARKSGEGSASLAGVSDAGGGDLEQQLNKLRLGSTLDDVGIAGFTAAVPGYISTASGVVSIGIPFTMSADSGVFVNVLLDNNGLPLWLTPGNTPVLDVSEPYTLKLQP